MTSRTRNTLKDTLLFDPKQDNLAYTIAIIKPNTALESHKLEKIKTTIQQANFSIRNINHRDLQKQEAINLFYKHASKPYYDQLISYILSGPCCCMLLCHQTENPIEKWKKMIGPSDPQQAKKKEPNSLRAIYGKNLTENELHGSDNHIQANKQRDIFKFKIPQKIPQFSYNAYKINLQTLFKFIYPPNLEHSNVNQRLDILGYYGPVYNYHSVDQCLCKQCSWIGKDKIQEVRKQKIAIEKNRIGLSDLDKRTQRFLGSTKSKPQKIKLSPIRLLKQQDLKSIWDNLCENCKNHIQNYSHLLGGRQMQHILTNQQIAELGKQMNHDQLLQLLIIQKGSAAKVMIDAVPIIQPKQCMYNKQFIKMLLQPVPTDYYQRYDFNCLRNLILEDRRIRMTYWISKLTTKPVDRFPPITALDSTLTKQQLETFQSPYFTLSRKLPLPILYPLAELKNNPLQLEKTLIDKKRLFEPELILATQKRCHRNLTKVSTIGQKMKGQQKNSVSLLRDYNQGRHGTWDNYSGLVGNSKKGLVGGKYGQ